MSKNYVEYGGCKINTDLSRDSTRVCPNNLTICGHQVRPAAGGIQPLLLFAITGKGVGPAVMVARAQKSESGCGAYRLPTAAALGT
jgi:hypothetical protein